MDLPELTDRELLLRALERITTLEIALAAVLAVTAEPTDRLPTEELEEMH